MSKIHWTSDSEVLNDDEILLLDFSAMLFDYFFFLHCMQGGSTN